MERVCFLDSSGKGLFQKEGAGLKTRQGLSWLTGFAALFN